MKVVDYKEYAETKQKFMEAHDYDFHIETSPMDEHGRYHKEYIFEDGSIFYEVMSPVVEPITTEVHKCVVTVNVKFFRTEFWSSDNAESGFYYEKF
jgi:hypothetical protein